MKTTIKILVIGLILATSFTACKKDDQGLTVASAYDYIPLKVGNYWAFEIKEKDSAGNVISDMGKDTFRVTKDTIMMGKTYYWLAGIQPPGVSFDNLQNNWLTDSATFLINQKGERFFSATNFKDTFKVKDDSWIGSYTLKTFYKMAKPSNDLTVPTGTFQVINAEGNIYFEQQGTIHSKQKLNNYYAKGVGFVGSSTFFIASENDIITSLTGYKVQ